MGNPVTTSQLPLPGASIKGASIPSLRQHPTHPTVSESDIARPQHRESGSHDKRKRRGALFGAIFMIALALAGTGFFFKDQVSLYWKQAQLKWKSHDTAESNQVAPAVIPQTPAPQQANTTAANGGKTPVPFDPKATTTLPTTAEKTSPEISGPVVPPNTTGPKPTDVPPSPAQEQPVVKNPVAPVEKPITPPAPIASGTTENPVNPPGKVEGGPESLPVRRALPVGDEPSGQKSLDPNVQKPSAQLNSGTLIEIPGTRDGTTGKVDPSQIEDKIFISATPDAQPAANALKQFFSAKTWQDRLALTQAPEKMRPLMERYYGANKDGSIQVARIELIRHDRAPETGSPHCVFQVTGPALEQPLPVMVESSPEGWKVDWLTFTEFKDKLMLRFLQSWSDEPGRFHVMMRRTHYFDEDVPDLDKKYCFELTPPEPGVSGFVFVPKGSPLAKELDRSLGWEITNVAAVVELQWRKQDRYQWVEMTAVPQYNWRGPTTAKGGAGTPSNEVGKPVTVEKAKPVEETATQFAAPRGIRN
ncbi:MAG: hypothetical protein WCN98_01120 [Verrucomicrobiaceae bacterium]